MLGGVSGFLPWRALGLAWTGIVIALAAPETILHTNDAYPLKPLLQGLAGPMKTNGKVVDRHADLCRDHLSRFASEVYPSDNFGMLHLQRREMSMETFAA